MSRRRRRARRIERLKSVLIAVLSVTAILLTTQILPWKPPSSVAPSGNQGTEAPQTAGGETGTALAPMRMAVTLRDDELQRYGVQYQREGSQQLFQQVYSLLLESLSGAGPAETVGESRWRDAMATAPGVYLDWQTELPLSVVMGWFSVENPNLTGNIRRMVLTEQDGTMLLYWADEEGFYVSEATLVGKERLAEAVSGLKDNGARFAFELEQYNLLDPYTMVLGQTPEPKVYTASNPLANQATLNGVLENLNFPERTSASYDGAGALVIRNEGDTLRVAADGSVTYEAAEWGSDRYGRLGEDASSVADGCRLLAQQMMSGVWGEAGLYLQSVEETEPGVWTVRLDYTLNGIRVQLSRGFCALFTVKEGTVTQFQLMFRSYQDSGTTAVMLPERQAMAAMAARGHEEEELLLVYLDAGGQTASPYWAAAGELKAEE